PLVSYAQEKQDDTKPKQEEAKPAAKVPQHEEAKPAEKPAESMTNKSAQEEKRTQEGQGAEERKDQEKQAKEEKKEDKKQQQNESKSTQENGRKEQTRAATSGSERSRAQSTQKIPDEKFRASFGPQHHYRVSQPIIVEGRPRIQVAEFFFEFIDPWPVDWSYSDDCYIDFIDGEYFLFN